MPYDRILDLMSPLGCPNVYLLGVYAKRLTVYSQQIRAVNLIDAIHWYRRPLKNVEVAVVGAGAAGITAAARALRYLRYDARVTLIERLQHVLEIQNKSDRWLHPTLYEWPFSGLHPDEDTTQLPLINWTTGTAQHVAQTLAMNGRIVTRTKLASISTRKLLRSVQVANREKSSFAGATRQKESKKKMRVSFM